MSEKKLRVIVFTQQDRFFIPKNIYKASQVCDILEIVDIQCKSSLENRISDFVKWFGFFQCAKMGLATGIRVLKSILDNFTKFKKYNGFCSVKDVANSIKVPYTVLKNVNASDYVEKVRKLQPDLIISYSAPQVVKPELLSIPKFGVINVHGSLLPDYRGCLPSFWYLYNGEKEGGATVHFMSEKIDDGDIFVQGKADISMCNSMFEIMKKTKELGGDLIVEAIKLCTENKIETRANIATEGRYFTWPTIEQARDFRKQGKRLI